METPSKGRESKREGTSPEKRNQKVPREFVVKKKRQEKNNGHGDTWNLAWAMSRATTREPLRANLGKMVVSWKIFLKASTKYKEIWSECPSTSWKQTWNRRAQDALNLKQRRTYSTKSETEKHRRCYGTPRANRVLRELLANIIHGLIEIYADNLCGCIRFSHIRQKPTWIALKCFQKHSIGSNLAKHLGKY